MLSVDTGPAHAAAAIGLPQVVLFGAADPALYRPRAAPGVAVICVQTTPPGPPSRGLSLQAVIDAVESLPLRRARAFAPD